MLLKFIKISTFKNLFESINNIIEFNNNIHVVKFKMKDTIITDPNSITNKFENIMDSSWTYADIFDKINCIEGASIDKDGKFAYFIDNQHSLEILKDNIHFVKLFPSHLNNLIDILLQHNINFEVI